MAIMFSGFLGRGRVASIKYLSIAVLVPILSLLSFVYTATAYAPVDQQTDPWKNVSLGIAPEEFIRFFNFHVKDESSSKNASKKLIPSTTMNFTFENGVGIAKVDYGVRGMLEFAVNDTDGSLLEVKFSDSNEIPSIVPVGTLMSLADEVSKEGVERFLDNWKVTEGDTLSPGFHSQTERDGNYYSLTVTKEGWCFIVRPSRAQYSIFDDKPNLLAKKEVVDKKKKADRKREDQPVIQEVSHPDDLLVLVNKKWRLPADYIPSDLVVPQVRFGFSGEHSKKKMRKEAAKALEALFLAAEEKGYLLYAQSGYRPYERQEVLFASYTRRFQSVEKANQVRARPGHSEHQTGLAMDITSASVNMKLTTSFGNTPEGKWVASHAHEFGFIIRYPKGKESITGYQYEPWHLRYVGKEAAKEIYERELTLEEYLEDR